MNYFTVETIAAGLTDLPWVKGEPAILILSGCNSGTGINSYIQILANRVGKKYPDFEIYGAGGWNDYDILTGESRVRGDGKPIAATLKPTAGTWYVFGPKNRDPDPPDLKKLRRLLRNQQYRDAKP
jgi:hypothetical protein